jgi:hypothetical protein
MTRKPHPPMSRAYLDWLQKVNTRRPEQGWIDPFINDDLKIERVALFVEESEPDGPLQRVKRWFQ